MRVPDMTTKHPVMACPVCHQDIVADVTVSIHPGRVAVNKDGTADVDITARMERFHVTHHCQGCAEAHDPSDEGKRDE